MILLYTIMYSVFALRSFNVALNDDLLYTVYTTELILAGPDPRVIRTNTRPMYL
jgi:hypothetical protein